MNTGVQEFSVVLYSKLGAMGKWRTSIGQVQMVYQHYNSITTVKLDANHSYLALGWVGMDISNSNVMSSRFVTLADSKASMFNFLDARTQGSAGGGVVTAAVIRTNVDCELELVSYGYIKDLTYTCTGKIIAVQLL